MLALLDCNNFYVSCERRINPDLKNVPVVVLSNNDGCVISRSEEAKALGIPMGAPAFKYKNIFEANGVQIFSPKFEYYNSVSVEIMRYLENVSPEYEVYSIDEAFIDFNGFKYFNLKEYTQKVRRDILDQFGIPVSIGMGPTKTLCKVASRMAKKNPDFDGVFFLDTPEKIEEALQKLDVEDVWGIGRRLSTKFKDYGIYKAADLFQKPEIWIRKMMGIHGVRLLEELKGNPQLVFEAAKNKKSIATTRSFMQMITDREELRERVDTFAMYCAEKLRRQHTCCKRITVFVQTNRFRQDLPPYFASADVVLPNASNSTFTLCREVSALFDKIFAEGFHYKKAGVIVSDFVPENERVTSLFDEDFQDRHLPLMRAMDRMNRKYGKDKIRVGGTSGKSVYNREIISEEYRKFLNNNILEEGDYRFL